jgi:hypothetical protein
VIKSAYENTEECPVLTHQVISLPAIFLFLLLGHLELIHYPKILLRFTNCSFDDKVQWKTTQYALRTLGPVNFMSLLTFAGGGIASITYEPLKIVPSRVLTITPSSMY